MLDDFRKAVLKYWPLEDLFDLGVAPTSYVDDLHAFAFLPMGIGDDQEETQKPVLKSGPDYSDVAGGWCMEGEPSRMETGVASEMIEKAEYRLVSSDSHVMEPPDLWTRFIDPEYRHRAPRVVREDGFDRWYADGDVSFGIVGSDTQAGRRFEAPETIQIEGVYEEVRRGGYDPHAHVEDMNLDGVSGDVVYPSVGLETWLIPSTDLLSAVFRAYNNWLAEFCAPYPDRIKGMAMVNVDVVADGVGELRRAASLGLAGATIPQRPLFGRYDAPYVRPVVGGG